MEQNRIKNLDFFFRIDFNDFVVLLTYGTQIQGTNESWTKPSLKPEAENFFLIDFNDFLLYY